MKETEEQLADASYWAEQLGGNATFRDVPTGGQFHFPTTPKHVFTKTSSGWYTDGKNHFRTGKLTAVVKIPRLASDGKEF